jgi:hypothetical protein
MGPVDQDFRSLGGTGVHGVTNEPALVRTEESVVAKQLHGLN